MMDKVDAKIDQIRKRVIETEKVELKKTAAKLYPNDVARQDKYVFQKLSAKYGFRKNEGKVEMSDVKTGGKSVETMDKPAEIHDPSLGKRLTLEELLALPLEECLISFTIVNSLRPM